jgi:hypothetical protein
MGGVPLLDRKPKSLVVSLCYSTRTGTGNSACSQSPSNVSHRHRRANSDQPTDHRPGVMSRAHGPPSFTNGIGIGALSKTR